MVVENITRTHIKLTSIEEDILKQASEILLDLHKELDKNNCTKLISNKSKISKEELKQIGCTLYYLIDMNRME